MKLFNSIQKSFGNVGIYLHQAFESHSINSKNLMILAILGTNIILSAFFLLFKAKTFGEFSESFYFTATLTLIFVVIGEFVRKTPKINQLITNFEETIQKRPENPSSKQIYEKMNERIEKQTQLIHFALVDVSLPAVLMPNLLVSYFLYFTTDLDSEAFRLAFPIWLPFEWRTPFGYLIPFLIQSVATYYAALSPACYLSFLFGSCETLQTLSKDVKSELYTLNEINKTDENPAEFKKKMCEFVDSLSDLRQFARDFSEVYEIIITAFFLWSLTTICGTLLIVQAGMSSGNLIDVVRPLTMIFWSFAANFFFCNFGEQVSNELESITDGIYECDWYSFPTEVQKMALTIMTATQRPVILRGFGNVLVTRETFTKVANGGYSYFTVLRRFNN